MKAWMKGGIIAIIINIILFLIVLFAGIDRLLWTTHFPFLMYNMAFNWNGSMSFPSWSNLTLSGGFIHIAIGFLITLFIYFIIGALIGWIVGKIKSKY